MLQKKSTKDAIEFEDLHSLSTQLFMPNVVGYLRTINEVIFFNTVGGTLS